MNKIKRIHLFIKLDEHSANQLEEISKEKYGKVSISLLTEKMLLDLVQQATDDLKYDNTHQEQLFERLTLRLPPKQQAYLTQKAKLQHSTRNDVARDIIAEYMTKNPVLSNDAVQALYQSNYQLLRMGQNINQLARQFNAILPQAITTQLLNEIIAYLDYHTDIIHEVIQNENKPLKFSESRRLMYAAVEQTD